MILGPLLGIAVILPGGSENTGSCLDLQHQKSAVRPKDEEVAFPLDIPIELVVAPSDRPRIIEALERLIGDEFPPVIFVESLRRACDDPAGHEVRIIF